VDVKNRTLALVVVAVACVAVGCGSDPVIGVVLPQTGDASSYGSSIESGMELAIDDARERGTLPEGFQVFWADSGSSPEQAAAEFRRLVEEHGVKMVLGAATSAEAQAIIPVADAMNVVCLSPSASKPGLAKQSKMFYRIYPSDELEGLAIAKFINERMRTERVHLLVGNEEYVGGIEPEFQKEFVKARGGVISARVNLLEDGWENEVQRFLREDPPTVVLVIAYSRETLETIRALRDEGYQGRIITSSAFFTEDILDEAGEDAEGVFFPLPPFERTAPTGPIEGFVARYLKTYNLAPDIFAAHGYDAMNLAIQAVTTARPTETPEIEKALRFGVGDIPGVTGAIIFDDYGDVKHYHTMFTFFEGRVITYKSYLKIVRDRILSDVKDVLDIEDEDKDEDDNKRKQG
jgi:branched-chain amino acid transport system substrate-binding protein